MRHAITHGGVRESIGAGPFSCSIGMILSSKHFIKFFTGMNACAFCDWKTGSVCEFRRVENPVHRILVALEVFALAGKHQTD